MSAQIINLSLQEVFESYKAEYQIPQDICLPGLLAIEIRKVEAGKVNLNNISNEKNIYYLPKGDHLNILITGTIDDFNLTCKKYFKEDLREVIYSAINNYSHYEDKVYRIANKDFSTKELLIMGIVNVTPDSFSDGGKYFDYDKAFSLAEGMLLEGADIIDIGGESSRPGSEFISSEKELNRVLPVINRLKEKYPNSIISVDTTKSEVALKALEAGASIINDISGATFDVKILDVVKQFNAALVLMHIKGIPKNMQENVSYENLVREVYDFLWQQSSLAKLNGVNNIIIDPGIGFGKNVQHNLELTKRLSDFRSMGFPILFGSSRKSYLGKITGLDVSERDVISVISDSFAVSSGASIIRTHNVKYGLQLKKFYKAIRN